MSHPSNKTRTAIRNSQSRYLTSPLWRAFVNGMCSADLARATGGMVARVAAARFLESAVASGAAIRRKEGGIVRYWKTDEAPAPEASYEMGSMRPLKSLFSRRVLPMRAGGVVMPVNWQGRSYETVGDRGSA